MNETIQITCLCAHWRNERGRAGRHRQQSGKQMAHRLQRRIIYRLLGHAIIIKRVISRNKRSRVSDNSHSLRVKRNKGDSKMTALTLPIAANCKY